MKISLKTLLVCIVLLSIGLRLYLLHREAELGVKVPVPKPIELEEYYDAPNFITEIRSRWQVREHDGLEAAEKAKDKEETRAKLLGSLAEFSSNVHVEVLHENREEMIALAHSQMEDPAYKTARNAAWVLDHFGDETAYPKARQRLIDLYAQKPRPGYRPFYDFLDYFGRERLAKDQEFIAFARSLANEPKELDWASTSFLSYQNIDDEPYYQHMLGKARNGRNKASAFIGWLRTSARRR